MSTQVCPQTSYRVQNVNFAEVKLETAKQSSDLKCELTYSGKDRTLSDQTITTQDTHFDHDYKLGHNQSLSDPEFSEVHLKGCLSETLPVQEEQRDLGTYIRSLIGKLEECYSMLPKIDAKADFNQEVLTKLTDDIENFAVCLKNQAKSQVILPSVTVQDVDSLVHDPLSSDFDINNASINSEETDHSHLERQLAQIRVVSCDLNDTNLCDFKNSQYLKVVHFPTGIPEILKHETEKPQDYCIDVSKPDIMLSTNLHEEVIPVRKIIVSPNERKSDTSECLTTRRACLKKQESKNNEPAYKTVTFMDPSPAAATTDRFKLEHHQIRKQERKPAKRRYCNGWD